MDETWPFTDIHNSTSNLSRPQVHRLSSLLDDVKVIHAVIITVDLAAILANSLVLMIIVWMPLLRKFVSSLLVSYLCILDILVSIASIVKIFRIALDTNMSWFNDTFCGAYEFLNSVFVFAIIGCILTINIDKYHSIKYPMHYSNTVTKTSAILMQGISLLVATLFALTPIFLSKHAHLKSCALSYSQGLVGVYFSVVTILVYFVIPSIAMMLINISVYKVAKQSLARISVAPRILYDAFCVTNIDQHPNSPNTKLTNIKRTTISVLSYETEDRTITKPPDHLRSSSTGNVKTKMSSEVNANFPTRSFNDKRMSLSCCELNNLSEAGVNVSANGAITWVNKHTMFHALPQPCDQAERNPAESIQALRGDSFLSKSSAQTSSSSSDNQRTTRKRRRTNGPRTNYKALRNLVIPFLYFVVLWGTYFYSQLLQTKYNALPYDSVFGTVSGLLVHVSFILNPIFYVWMKKNFKEEATEFFRKCRRRKSFDASLNSTGVGQTFEQFLEASSTI